MQYVGRVAVEGPDLESRNLTAHEVLDLDVVVRLLPAAVRLDLAELDD